MTVNKAILVGNLGKDPELRTTPTGRQCCIFTLATTERWNDENGQKQEQTTWHNMVAWGRQAEVMHQYLSKGNRVYIEGRIVNRSYDDKEGNKRYVSEVVVQNFQFLDSKNGDRQERESEEDRPERSSRGREARRPVGREVRGSRQRGADLPF